MAKGQRVQAALARRPVDRPPVAFWRHVPEVDHNSAGLAEAMLAFQRRWDLDLIKIMSSGVYCDDLYNLVSSKGRGLYYKNERVDALFDLGRGTMDTTKRCEVYRDLARAMVEDATWVFLLQQVDIYATHDRMSWTPRMDQWMPLHEAALR